LSEGFAVDPQTGVVSLEKYKYFTNLIEMPVILVLFLLGIVSVLWGIIGTLLSEKFKKGIWFSGAGTIVTVCCLLLIAGYNNTSFYPSINQPTKFIDHFQFLIKRIHPECHVDCIVDDPICCRIYFLRLESSGEKTHRY